MITRLRALWKNLLRKDQVENELDEELGDRPGDWEPLRQHIRSQHHILADV